VSDLPFPVFRFQVEFVLDAVIAGTNAGPAPAGALAEGAFAECTGLDATMEPKVIKEGGWNYGPAQRPGPVTFGTVVLKRGITRSPDLWNWFVRVNGTGAYAYRLAATINVFAVDGTAAYAWHLDRALPIKYRGADLNARGGEIGIEELHLAHEGLTMVKPTKPKLETAP
jgi:phage tail-like protein